MASRPRECIMNEWEALVENLADRDSDLSDLDEESDFYEPSHPEESSEEEMSDKNDTFENCRKTKDGHQLEGIQGCCREGVKAFTIRDHHSQKSLLNRGNLFHFLHCHHESHNQQKRQQ